MAETTIPRNNDSDLLKSLLPSGIASVCLHGLTVVITILCLRGCNRGMPTEEGGEVFHTVGVAQLSDRGADEATGDDPVVDADQPPQDGLTETPVDSTDVVPDTPPSVDELLNASKTNDRAVDADSLEVIGPGSILPGLPPPAAVPQRIRSRGSAAGGGAQDAGPDETIFMNIADSGTKFVYLIDTSGSMSDGGRIGLAKRELKKSIQMLQPHQQFQVVFYSESTTQLKLGKQERDLYPANVINKQKAIAKIDIVNPAYGTQYLPALKHALQLEPDVLYFLTDGVGVEANLRVDDLLRLNTSNARIHVVEFGSADRESRLPTWLHRLANRTQGQYRRIAVTGRHR